MGFQFHYILKLSHDIRKSILVSHFPSSTIVYWQLLQCTIMTSSHAVECLPGTVVLYLRSATYALFLCLQEQTRLHQ